MTASNDNARKYWMYTAISFAALVVLMIFWSEFFWIALPFLLTYAVKAYGAM